MLNPETPTRAWAILQKSKVCVTVPQVSSPPKPGHTRFVCISDTHGHAARLKKIPDGDVLLHAGDFTSTGRPDEVKKFDDFLASQPHKTKIVIAGNHEMTFDEKAYPALAKRFHPWDTYDVKTTKALLKHCIYLEDEETKVHGFRIYGSPWQPEFGNWGFNLPRGQACQEKWAKIPEGIDILMTHGPPLGYGDLCLEKHRAGCVNLLETVERIAPRYHVFGHIHEGYGVTTNNKTTFINASSCNRAYDKFNLNAPIVFDLPNLIV